ncbi:MAG: tetratricopeptide repeat protein [Candidatus Latescibacteria bacterium]|nr:tetratricopeptide repeat protein [Candidatus Latescibacterota bacterium]
MTRNALLILGFILALAAGLRFYGLDWGTDHQTGTFHTFHPDEKTLIDSAALIGDDMSKIVSSYGKAPMYLLAGLAHSLGFITSAEPFQDVRFTHLVGRSISALLGTLTVLITFLIGRTLGSLWTGILSAFFMAICAGHIQQSHYYTVDASLAFWVSLALYLAIRLPDTRIYLYIAFGLAIGFATGTRLVGVWLAIPFVLAHLIPLGPPLKKGEENRYHLWLRQILPPFSKGGLGGICIATAVGLVIALICEPFLILDPELFFSESDARRLIPSMQIAQGELVRIWTLHDFSTTPYAFYLTHLLRDAAGYPLEIAAFFGIGLALWQRNRTGLILLGWLLPYFLLVGGLHTKPIRYVTPMLPTLAIFAAWSCIWMGQHLRNLQRFAPAIPAILIGIPTLLYGLATVSIYGQEDCRITASQWIAKNIPQNASVLAEMGGFPTMWMVPNDRYRTRPDQPSFFLNTEGCFPYNEHITFIDDQLRGTDWIVVINENRMRQFEGAPHHYPIAHAYYRKLKTGQLGYTRAAEFRVSPTLLGYTFRSPDADPTVTSYDHPTVTIYRRIENVAERIATWREDVRRDPTLPDRELFSGVEAYKAGNYPIARLAFQRTINLRPNFLLGHLMIINTYFREGREQEAESMWKKLDAQFDGIPAEVGMGMVKANLVREGTLYLEHCMTKYLQAGQSPGWIRKAAAESWYLLGEEYHQRHQLDAAQNAFTRATELVPDYHVAYVGLSEILLEQGHADQALSILKQVNAQDLKNSRIWRLMGKAHQNLGDMDKAQFYERQAKALSGT